MNPKIINITDSTIKQIQDEIEEQLGRKYNRKLIKTGTIVHIDVSILAIKKHSKIVSAGCKFMNKFDIINACHSDDILCDMIDLTLSLIYYVENLLKVKAACKTAVSKAEANVVSKAESNAAGKDAGKSTSLIETKESSEYYELVENFAILNNKFDLIKTIAKDMSIHIRAIAKTNTKKQNEKIKEKKITKILNNLDVANELDEKSLAIRNISVAARDEYKKFMKSLVNHVDKSLYYIIKSSSMYNDTHKWDIVETIPFGVIEVNGKKYDNFKSFSISNVNVVQYSHLYLWHSDIIVCAGMANILKILFENTSISINILDRIINLVKYV